MDLALYAPGLGYYSAGSIKIGPGGDFVTAPEVSDLFSRCLARQCAEIVAESGGEILELGAGTGRMAAAILETLSTLGVLPERYVILEVSADLADRQRARLMRLPEAVRRRVAWVDRLPERPMRGVVLANEVLDALPFRRFRMLAGEAHELGVALGAEEFVFRERPARQGPGSADTASAFLQDLPWPLPDGYTCEIRPRTQAWIAGLGDCIGQGALLLFDYGLPRAQYYHPQRVEGTLRCYFKQRAHDDPLLNIGVQDITAWVDFSHVAHAAQAAGLDVKGFATQAAFLLATGIEGLVAEAADGLERIRRAGEARRLLLPGEMGEAFKVMALTRNVDGALAGFAHQDLRDSL